MLVLFKLVRHTAFLFLSWFIYWTLFWLILQSEYRTMAAFVLAMIVQNYKPGQELVHQGKAISICLLHLEYRSDHRLRSWCSLCLGQVSSSPLLNNDNLKVLHLSLSNDIWTKEWNGIFMIVELYWRKCPSLQAYWDVVKVWRVVFTRDYRIN